MSALLAGVVVVGAEPRRVVQATCLRVVLPPEPSLVLISDGFRSFNGGLRHQPPARGGLRWRVRLAISSSRRQC
jgi:hypothetical protein